MDEQFGQLVEMAGQYHGGLGDRTPIIHQDIRYNVHFGLSSLDGMLPHPAGQDEHIGAYPKTGFGVGWRPGEGRD